MRDSVWSRLERVTALRFRAQGSAHTGWSGTGSGTVVVTAPREGVLLFAEAGLWQTVGGRPVPFHNTYRWTEQPDGRLRLEHLRFGPERPVFLFDLAPEGAACWRSVAPHLCRDDAYTAVLTRTDDTLHLDWRADGPRKSEHIAYEYRDQVVS